MSLTGQKLDFLELQAFINRFAAPNRGETSVSGFNSYVRWDSPELFFLYARTAWQGLKLRLRVQVRIVDEKWNLTFHEELHPSAWFVLVVLGAFLTCIAPAVVVAMWQTVNRYHVLIWASAMVLWSLGGGYISFRSQSQTLQRVQHNIETALCELYCQRKPQ